MAVQSAAHRKIVERAKKEFKRGMEWEATWRPRACDDEKFANGDDINLYQWTSNGSNMAADRQLLGRPALTINKVQQHNLQVKNDARQNKASVRVHPSGEGATYQAAQCFQGCIRHIEYQSNASTAYDKAFSDQIDVGMGYFYIDTDYVDDNSFDQEIFIRRVPSWQSVVLDPDIQEYDGSDSNFGFIFTDMPNDQFEAKYGIEAMGSGSKFDGSGWVTKDHTRVAKYFSRSMVPDTLYVTKDGQTSKASDYAGTDMAAVMREAVKSGEIKSRKILNPQIKVYKIAGDRILEESDWAGAYIPIVRVVGIETVIDGILDRRGHTRAMRDPQKMYNYWTSCAVEFGALQTKAPFIGMAEAIEGREEDWASANIDNPAVLTYNGFDENGNKIDRPERAQPPVASAAYTSGMQTAANEIMSVSGQYQAELGMPSNEKSGVAIDARQRQSNNSTYHFVDHQAIAIRYGGKIMVDLIPKIYDTQRVIRILAEDDTAIQAHIDPDHSEAHSLNPPSEDPAQSVFSAAAKAKLIFNPGVGRYDVMADVGPNFGTQREEAFSAFSQIISQNHELVNVIGDLMFKSADFPGADQIAERFAEMRAGSTVPKAQFQETQKQMAQLHATLVQMTETLADEKRKKSDKDSLRDVEIYRAETDRMSAVAKVDPAALLPLIRQMVSDVLGTPALPEIARHQAANAAMAPASDDTPQDPMALQAQAHGQAVERAKLGLAANAQQHQQHMDVIDRTLAVHNATKPAPKAAV